MITKRVVKTKITNIITKVWWITEVRFLGILVYREEKQIA